MHCAAQDSVWCSSVLQAEAVFWFSVGFSQVCPADRETCKCGGKPIRPGFWCLETKGFCQQKQEAKEGFRRRGAVAARQQQPACGSSNSRPPPEHRNYPTKRTPKSNTCANHYLVHIAHKWTYPVQALPYRPGRKVIREHSTTTSHHPHRNDTAQCTHSGGHRWRTQTQELRKR